jgi:hypothetical protein
VIGRSQYVGFANGFEPAARILSENHERSVIPGAMTQMKPTLVSVLTLPAQKTDCNIAVSERDSQYSYQQQYGVPVLDSVDEQTSPTDQDMVDCEFSSLKILPFIPCV